MDLPQLIHDYDALRHNTSPAGRAKRREAEEAVLAHPDVERLLLHIAITATEGERGWTIGIADLDRAILATSKEHAETLRRLVTQWLYILPLNSDRVSIGDTEAVRSRREEWARIQPTLTRAEGLSVLMLGAEGELRAAKALEEWNAVLDQL